MSLGSYMLTPGIRFNDCTFSEPTPLDGWTPPKCAGLFAIVVGDPSWAPRPFHALYFGEFGNNISLAVLMASCYSLLGAYRGKTLMVSVLPMPFSTTAQRCALRSELIWAYNPPFQTDGAERERVDLARKLEELEKRHQEQTAQVMLLLANANRGPEPLPEPRRRSIGFLSPSEPADSGSGERRP